MKILVLRDWGADTATRKLAERYPDVTWTEVNIVPYKDKVRRIEALVDIVNMFDGVIVFDTIGSYKNDGDDIYIIAIALGKQIYTEADYPLGDEEAKGEEL